jgi:phosphoribosylaminoimidazolecarboxamide formyltransferase/IMP cyclohydrolase
VSAPTRFRLACKAFAHTAAYDGAISSYLSSLADDGTRHAYPDTLTLQFSKVQDLRYGENPHQSAALYRENGAPAGQLVDASQLQGKELSYNNIADADAAWSCVSSLPSPACVIIKHANPCGVAMATTALEAYVRAFATDPDSAFGGIIAFNAPVDVETATAVASRFVEVVIAPAFDEGALAVFAAKPNVRLLALTPDPSVVQRDFKRIGGGLLVQSSDAHRIEAADLKVVTARQPGTAELDDLLFAWRVARFVKSNAIVFAAGGRTLGIGAGQMSRVDSARIAAIKARAAGLDLAGSAVASDAFFPFPDGLEVVLESGATAVIQPGGSIRDDSVIAAANARGAAMVFTGVRHFRH